MSDDQRGEGIRIETKEGGTAQTMKPSKQGVKGGETKEGPAQGS